MSHAALFSTVANQDALAFGSGDQFRPRHVVDFLNLKSDDVSKIAGVAKSSVRYDDAIPQPMRDRIREIADICNQVAVFFDGDADKTALWFRTPNPMLGNVSPRDMLRFGRYDKLRRFVVGAIIEARKDSGQPAGKGRAGSHAAAR